MASSEVYCLVKVVPHASKKGVLNLDRIIETVADESAARERFLALIHTSDQGMLIALRVYANGEVAVADHALDRRHSRLFASRGFGLFGGQHSMMWRLWRAAADCALFDEEQTVNDA